MHLEVLKENEPKKSQSLPDSLLKSQPSSGNVYYAIAFLLLVATLNQVTTTIGTKSGELKANAAAQDGIVDQLEAIKFVDLPSKPTPATIRKISEINKRISGFQQVLQEQLISMRQAGQGLMTSGHTDVSTMEQDGNTNSTLLGTIHTIFTMISSMAPGKGKTQ